MTAISIQADARALPLPDDSVDLVVTSPPYYVLRDYQDGGGSLKGQLGNEPTPTEYLNNMVDCIREWKRVLKPCGSIFINIGDKYASAPSGPRTPMPDGYDRDSWRETFTARHRKAYAAATKSLLGIPWRLALRCIDDLNLILRAEIIWSKVNGLPESVTDRVRRSHEVVFHFTLQPTRYYSAVDEVREEYAPGTAERYKTGYRSAGATRADGTYAHGPLRAIAAGEDNGPTKTNPLGKLPGSVWSIPSSPLQLPEWLGVDHFASYPCDLIRPIILGWSPPGICVECGEGRRPTTTKTATGKRADDASSWNVGAAHFRTGQRVFDRVRDIGIQATITGYVCACPTPTAPTRPAIVLDPFGGTGTTALVASTHGRIGIGIDLSYDYCRAAQWRTHDPGERARALKVEKLPPVSEQQLGMFEELA